MSTPSGKPFYLSVTFWSLICMALAMAAKKFGYKVSDQFATEGAQAILNLIQLLGWGGALAGRARATKKLTLSLLLLCLLILPGCAALGLGKTAQVRAEEALTGSFDAVNTFLTIEVQNRDIIDQKLPVVAKLADNIRTHFKPTFALAETAVKNYDANPQTAESLEAEVISIAQQAAAALEQINQVSVVKYAPLRVPKK
jgi:hypothetical protein